MIPVELFDGVGTEGETTHVCIEVCSNALRLAIRFFNKLGYFLDDSRILDAEWGKSRFMIKRGALPIQLIEPIKFLPFHETETHLGLKVAMPQVVAAAITLWAHENGHQAEIEMYGNKVFVTINTILKVLVEFE